MTINISFLTKIIVLLKRINLFKATIVISVILSVIASTYFFLNDNIIAYGDAESHLNIAKRVVSSITPGMAQLGGIWPPLPHLMMVPFVYFDTLWRTGLGGTIVSGLCFLITNIYLF